MAPRRTHKTVAAPAVASDKRLARVTPLAELVYWRIHFASDSYGTLPGEPWDLWSTALPSKFGVDENAIVDALHELQVIGLVVVWIDEEGEQWVHVVDHDDTHLTAEGRSKRGQRSTPVPPAAIMDAARMAGESRGPLERRSGANAARSGAEAGRSGANGVSSIAARSGAEAGRSGANGPSSIAEAGRSGANGVSSALTRAQSIPTTTASTDDGAASAAMFERVVDTLADAGGTGTDRSMWQDLVDRYRTRHPETPAVVFADVADRMWAKVRSQGGSPFAFNTGASFWSRTFIDVRRDHEMAAEREPRGSLDRGKGDDAFAGRAPRRRSAAALLAQEAEIWGAATA